MFHTYWWGSSDLDGFVVWRSVVDGDTASGAEDALIGNDGNMTEGTVAGFEVQGRVPVVGEVLAEGARRASTLCPYIALHGRIEGVLLSVSLFAEDMIEKETNSANNLSPRSAMPS